MQNRGLIKFFAIIFALVCVYQLSFTFVANSIVSDAKAFAKGDAAKELRYLDSIGKEEVYLGHTYKEVTNNQINKGLDLEGGLNVILQISVKDVLKGLANDSKNPAFLKALADAKANQWGHRLGQRGTSRAHRLGSWAGGPGPERPTTWGPLGCHTNLGGSSWHRCCQQGF